MIPPTTPSVPNKRWRFSAASRWCAREQPGGDQSQQCLLKSNLFSEPARRERSPRGRRYGLAEVWIQMNRWVIIRAAMVAIAAADGLVHGSLANSGADWIA